MKHYLELKKKYLVHIIIMVNLVRAIRYRRRTLLRFSITYELCRQGASCKICFTLPSIMSQTSRETSEIFQRGQQVTLLVRDWRISIHLLVSALDDR